MSHKLFLIAALIAIAGASFAAGAVVFDSTSAPAAAAVASPAEAAPPAVTPCEKLARWRDQIIAEDYRPKVHGALAEEAWSMACGEDD